MLQLDFHPTGRHFLQIPGPSPVPDRILRAMSLPTIDHRGPEFGALGLKVLDGIKQIFQTRHPVAIYPASGTGAWEAALLNTLGAGDLVLMYETGHFASLWNQMAARLGIQTELLAYQGNDDELPNAASWRRGVQADLIGERLAKDPEHRIKAICGGAQRNVDRRHVRHPCGAASDRCGQAPGAAAGRQHFGPCQRRLPARRMGRGRDRERLAKGADAAAWHQLQRAVTARARSIEKSDPAALVLRLG